MRKKIRQLIVKWLNKLALSWWVVEYRIAKTMPNTKATTTFELANYTALMKIDANYLTTEKDLEQTILHELLHLFLVPYREVFLDIMPYLDENTQKSFRLRFQRVDEQLVVKLTTVILQMNKEGGEESEKRNG